MLVTRLNEILLELRPIYCMFSIFGHYSGLFTWDKTLRFFPNINIVVDPNYCRLTVSFKPIDKKTKTKSSPSIKHIYIGNRLVAILLDWISYRKTYISGLYPSSLRFLGIKYISKNLRMDLLDFHKSTWLKFVVHHQLYGRGLNKPVCCSYLK